MTEQTKTPLQHVLDALHEAKAAGKSLYMPGYFKQDEVQAEAIHECGSPACVMGWASLHKPLRDYLFDCLGDDCELDYPLENTGDLASYLPDVLSDEYPYRLIWAIAEGSWDERSIYYEDCAKDDGFPNNLINHPHLVKSSPTLDEAIDFITQIQPHADAIRQARMEQ